MLFFAFVLMFYPCSTFLIDKQHIFSSLFHSCGAIIVAVAVLVVQNTDALTKTNTNTQLRFPA